MHEGTVRKQTVFDLENLIIRCLDEAEKVGYIKKYETAAAPGVEVSEHAVGYQLKAIVNEIELCKHIAKTIIGELYEFEVIRQISPMFRQLRKLEGDFAYFDSRQSEETAMLGKRIGEI